MKYLYVVISSFILFLFGATEVNPLNAKVCWINNMDIALNSKVLPEPDVGRVSNKKKFIIVIEGELPKGKNIYYWVETSSNNTAGSKTVNEEKIEGKGKHELIVKTWFPDIYTASEKVSFVFRKPYNYNLSIADSENFDWRKTELIVPVDRKSDTIKLHVEEILPFQFFYIDISDFMNLAKVKKLIKDKVGAGNDYFIYVNNNEHPLIYQTGDDIDELLTKITLIRPEFPSPYNEIKYIKPYMDELVLDENRRKIQFNFLFSEVFLNHSSLDFMNSTIGKWLTEEALHKENIVVNFYSTINRDETSYEEDLDDVNKLKKINYKDINDY